MADLNEQPWNQNDATFVSEKNAQNERLFGPDQVVTIEDSDGCRSAGWRVLSVVEDDQGRVGWRRYNVGLRRASYQENDNGRDVVVETKIVTQSNLVKNNFVDEITSPEQAGSIDELKKYFYKLAGGNDQGYLLGSVGENGSVTKYLAQDILKSIDNIWEMKLTSAELVDSLKKITNTLHLRDKIVELIESRGI